MSNFDEKSGVVYCKTPWGQWGQTIEEVLIEVEIAEPGTRAKDIKCDIKPNSISVSVANEVKFKGSLFATVVKDDSVWTFEDKSLLRILLVKAHQDASNCWTSLLKGEYQCNALEVDKTEKKLTLERFQNENPGFDFSGAAITGNYHGGGPKLTN